MIKNPAKKEDMLRNCECDAILYRDDMGYVCGGCGSRGTNILVAEYDPLAWRKKKSVHNRLRWFSKRCHSLVNSVYIGVLREDFRKVVNFLVNNGLVKKNISKYDYYIIRLASRNNVKLIRRGELNDLKKGKTKERFDNNLFGAAYPHLGWDTNANKCKYFKKWKKLKKKHSSDVS